MIEFHVDRSRGTPAYLQLVSQVRESLRLGWLRPGDRLPTAREVVASCGVNQNTVLKAYRELELAGLVEAKQGTGTFVSATLGSIDQDTMNRLREQLARWVQSARKAGLEGEDIRALVAAVLNDTPNAASQSLVEPESSSTRPKRRRISNSSA